MLRSSQPNDDYAYTTLMVLLHQCIMEYVMFLSKLVFLHLRVGSFICVCMCVCVRACVSIGEERRGRARVVIGGACIYCRAYTGYNDAGMASTRTQTDCHVRLPP